MDKQGLSLSSRTTMGGKPPPYRTTLSPTERPSALWTLTPELSRIPPCPGPWDPRFTTPLGSQLIWIPWNLEIHPPPQAAPFLISHLGRPPPPPPPILGYALPSPVQLYFLNLKFWLSIFIGLLLEPWVLLPTLPSLHAPSLAS